MQLVLCLGDEQMDKYGEKFTLPQSVLKTQAVLNEICSANAVLTVAEAWRAALPNYDFKGIAAVAKHYTSIAKSFPDARCLSKSALALTDAISAMQASVNMSSMAKAVLSMVDTSAFSALDHAAAELSALAKLDLSWVAEIREQEGVGEGEDILEEQVTPDIRAELAADITQTLSDPEQMQTVSQSKYLQWKERNPGLAALFLEILLPVLLTLLQIGAPIWLARLVRDSQVYEEPASASSVVYNLTVEDNVTVIGDVPYYYEVEFVNPETGEVVIGYVYKGNVVEEELSEMCDREEITEELDGDCIDSDD